MSTELVVALVGIGGALAGAVLQNAISAIAGRRRRFREQSASWGPVLVELLDAGSAVERWLRDESEEWDSGEVKGLTENLDHAWNKVLMLCPLEITRTAAAYLQVAHALLREESNLDMLDSETQKLSLVYRRVAGINKSLPWRHRGKRAQKAIAPESR